MHTSIIGPGKSVELWLDKFDFPESIKELSPNIFTQAKMSMIIRGATSEKALGFLSVLDGIPPVGKRIQIEKIADQDPVSLKMHKEDPDYKAGEGPPKVAKFTPQDGLRPLLIKPLYLRRRAGGPIRSMIHPLVRSFPRNLVLKKLPTESHDTGGPK